MKTECYRRDGRDGFTLVELLVVIAIIGLLMALLFPAIAAIRNQVYKSRTQTVLQQLVGASKNYYTEYGRWPGGTQSVSPADLVKIYNGWIDPLAGTKSDASSFVGQQNPKAIMFMEIKETMVSRPVNSKAPPGVLVDPWGTPLAYCFDSGQAGYAPPAAGGVWKDSVAYDNLVDKPFTIGSESPSVVGGSAFFSCGPDCVSGPGPSNPNNPGGAKAYDDDVKSW